MVRRLPPRRPSRSVIPQTTCPPWRSLLTRSTRTRNRLLCTKPEDYIHDLQSYRISQYVPPRPHLPSLRAAPSPIYHTDKSKTDNVPIISHGGSAVPAGLFSPNATGRVSPLGNFTGFTESIEYFFALALVPSPPSYSVFSSAKIVSFSSGCPEVAASVAWLETRVDHPNSTNDGEYLSTLKQVCFPREKEGKEEREDGYADKKGNR